MSIIATNSNANPREWFCVILEDQLNQITPNAKTKPRAP